MKPRLNSSDEIQKQQSANRQQAQELSDPQRRKELKENIRSTELPVAATGSGAPKEPSDSPPRKPSGDR